MTIWFGAAGGGVVALLGLVHLFYTLRDLAGPPKYFAPNDRELLDAMKRARVRLSPGGHDFWRAMLGFHISHSIAVIMVGGLATWGAATGETAMQAIALALTLIYAVIARRFWFAIPMWGCLIAGGLQAAGLAL